MYGSLILLRYSGFPARAQDSSRRGDYGDASLLRGVISRIMASGVVLSRIENSASSSGSESSGKMNLACIPMPYTHPRDLYVKSGCIAQHLEECFSELQERIIIFMLR